MKEKKIPTRFRNSVFDDSELMKKFQSRKKWDWHENIRKISVIV